MSKPPFNNMGAENISALVPKENRSLIDWFAFTVKTTDVHQAINEVGLQALAFQPSKSGGFGYRQSMRSGNIVVFFDGSDGMGCHFSFTGQGCRQYEAFKKTYSCWLPLFLHVLQIGAHITRLDLAIDNVDGALDIEKVFDLRKTGQVQSQFRNWGIQESGTFTNNGLPDGKTFYLGSVQSRIKIRIYDKAAQHKIPDCHWIRCELQLMSERAESTVRHLLSGSPLGETAVSILNYYFRPINSESENKSQCSTQSWWAAWLTTTAKLRITTVKAIKLVNESMEHLKKQYSASFAMIKKFLGVTDFHEFVHDLTDLGKQKLTKKHEWIIESSRLDLEPDTGLVYPF